MACTLWEEYIDIILSYLEEHNREPIVIILQMCRAKMFKDEVNTPNKSVKQKEVVKGSPAFKRALFDDFASSTTAKKLKEFVKKEDDDEKK
ncbi:hypothetical protein DH2020_041092 [Rehmannia glutinosa]|uniref:Uncharacterized protein n=1 Tax=Rehmannia glutinosa TaxID=99300 RepID=A0ABR0UR65_REHGL